MSTHNIGFYEELSTIINQLSSNTHLISSSVVSTDYTVGRASITQLGERRALDCKIPGSILTRGMVLCP